MPNYKYKCTECDYVEEVELFMSFDPKVKLFCAECQKVQPLQERTMTRRISKPSFQMERETLGKWYKDNTGRELMGE